MTLDPTLAREWLCRCAERVLLLYERTSPDDPRPRDAIAIARRYLAGNVHVSALITGTSDAQAAGTQAVRVHQDHAAECAAFAAAETCSADVAASLPPSFAQDAVQNAGGDVEAEARWQADALTALLLA